MDSSPETSAGYDPSRPGLPGPAKPQRWRTRVSWLFGLLVLAAVITVALHFTELERFVELARNAHALWLLAAAGLQGFTYFASAGVWWFVLWRRGQHLSFFSLVPMGLAKLFTDQALHRRDRRHDPGDRRTDAAPDPLGDRDVGPPPRDDVVLRSLWVWLPMLPGLLVARREVAIRPR